MSISIVAVWNWFTAHSLSCGTCLTSSQSSYRLTQVLDRVIAKVGGKEWWANLSGRAKAQQMWTAHRGGAKVVSSLWSQAIVGWLWTLASYVLASSLLHTLTELHVVDVVVGSSLYLFQHFWHLSPADLNLIAQGDALKNLNSYGLNARTRFALGRYVLCQPSAQHSF